MRKKFILTLILYFSVVANIVYAQTIQGSFESTFQRYQKGQQFVGVSSLTENLTAWKNERAYAHIILWSQTNRNNLSYEVSQLTTPTDTIPAEAVQLLFAKNVLADRYARNCGTYPQPRMDSVEIADALSFTSLTSVTSNDPIKMWVRVNVPENISAGIYSGVIQVKQNNSVQLTFTLNVEVLNKTLPDHADWTFHLDLWQYPGQILKHYNQHHPDTPISPWSASHFGMLNSLYQQLADAGQKVISAYLTDDVIDQPSMVTWILKTNGTWQYDFTNMDTWIDSLTYKGISKQINCFSTIGMGVDSLKYYDEASSSFKKLYMPMFSQTYYERWNDFLTAFKTHLANRNIFDKTVLFLDEVGSEAILKLDSLIHGNDPSWKMGLSYFHTLTQTESDIMYDISGNLDVATGQAREGKISTFYTSCAQTVPNTYVTLENSPAESAWMAWHTANMNLSGFLRWAYDFWTLDDPLNVQDGFFTSGENSFVYRSSNEINPEIYTSYRLEMLRKGIQDFEKIKILKDELQSSGDPFDMEALNLLNEKIAQFDVNSGYGAKTLVQEGSALLNAIVRGDFSSCKVSGKDFSSMYTQWLGVTGSSTPIGNTWAASYPGGYSHYTDGKITALPGGTVTLTVENSSDSYCARTAVWIDWNGDFDFEDDGENVWNGGDANSCNNATSNTFNVIIPSGTKPGIRRMRIQVRDSYLDEPTPCGEVSWSSTRDFDVMVADTYCQPLTRYNKIYFLRKASSSSCTENFNYTNDVLPLQGYIYDETNTLTMEKGTSFLLDIENSALSRCARTAIWIDWNQNSSFDDTGELVTLQGNSNSCDNPVSYRIAVTVPDNALAGETRMRIQQKDSYQDVPQSCSVDYVTGTTDIKLNITEASGLNCSPIIISPYDGEILSDTVVNYVWNANNLNVSEWKLKISNADSANNLPVYFEQYFSDTTASAIVSQLPHYGENLLVELSWKINGNWFSTVTCNKAVDLYCQSMGISNSSYFIFTLDSYNAIGNISYVSENPPENGYCQIVDSIIVVTPGSTFLLNINESSASRCAYTKVWIDWNENGDFTDSGDEVYASGLFENCNNDYEHSISIDVPSGVSLGVKRLRIRIGNSWLSSLEPCGDSGEITTYDVVLGVISAPQTVSFAERQSTGLRNLKQNSDVTVTLRENHLYVESQKSEALTGIYNIRLYSIDGRLIKIFNKSISPIYIGDIPSGVYLINVENLEGKAFLSKIFK
jgi:hypothetical protein